MKYEPISVSDLNLYIKDQIAGNEYLNNVLVKGEISNFKHHYTGHLYFTLKDGKSLIKCIMFKSYTSHLDFEPKDGMQVMVLGTVAVYERDGVYQIYCKAMQSDGIGNLYQKYEELKEKLAIQGYFDESHKKAIPVMPKVIGVLTSQTGAVIRDIINVSTRRNPNAYIRLLPVPVQGIGAEVKIANAIKIMNDKKLADVLIIARGGGSLEDLWPFNEEIVAKAIYDSEIPIISAVGHETDFTIADFVADLRAPTPSAAAELAVADVYELMDKINKIRTRYRLALKKKVDFMHLRYEKCMEKNVFKNPMQVINEKYIIIDNLTKLIEKSSINKLNESKILAGKAISKLDTLSPLKTLTRGYCIAEKNDCIIKSINDVENNDEINIRLADGNCMAKIIK